MLVKLDTEEGCNFNSPSLLNLFTISKVLGISASILLNLRRHPDILDIKLSVCVERW